MLFTPHLNLAGKHAILSPSSHAWINYDDDKMDRVFYTQQAARRGTELHELAYQLIRLGVKLPENTKSLNQYVNDAIGYRMTPEQYLYYSDNCFGTADCIGFNHDILRVHDLKTGVSPASIHQLEVYVALFCLEYKFNPNQIGMEMRIYQSDTVQVFDADPDTIFHIMDKIRTFSKRIDLLKLEVNP